MLLASILSAQVFAFDQQILIWLSFTKSKNLYENRGNVQALGGRKDSDVDSWWFGRNYDEGQQKQLI